MGTKITKEIVSYIHTAIGTIDEEKVQLFPPVLFMDTSFIMDAVWDSAPDWSHHEGEIRETETKFILSEILNN